MTGLAITGRPSGFWIALPDGWVGLDLEPGRAEVWMKSVLDVASAVDKTVQAHRSEVEQVFALLRTDAAAAGIDFCACFFRVVNETLAIQASLAIALRGVEQANDTAGLASGLSESGDERAVSIVEHELGPVVRRAGRKSESLPGADQPTTFVSCQYFIPVPGTVDQVAVLTFASPTLVLQEELLRLFDSMAASFCFTGPKKAT